MSLMASTATFDIANYDAKEFGNIEYEELERLGYGMLIFYYTRINI